MTIQSKIILVTPVVPGTTATNMTAGTIQGTSSPRNCAALVVEEKREVM